MTPVAITAGQPRASLLAHGIAEWHTSRARPRLEPGREVWVHAGKQAPTSADIPEGWFYDEETGRLGGGGFGSPVGGYRSFPLPLGAVLSRHRLAEVVPIVKPWPSGHEALPLISTWNGRLHWWPQHREAEPDRTKHVEPLIATEISDQLPYADWSPGRWAWRLELLERLETPVREYDADLDCDVADCSTSYCAGANGWSGPEYPICDGCNANGTRAMTVPVRGRPGIWHPNPALIAAVRGEG